MTWHSQQAAAALEQHAEQHLGTIKEMSHHVRLAYAALARNRPNVREALSQLVQAYPGTEKELAKFVIARDHNPHRHRGTYDKVR